MKCVPLTISYHLYFLCISKVSSMLHHRSMGPVQSKDKNAAFYVKISFFFWQSIKFLQQNINHSSETGNIPASITVNELFQKATYRWGGGGEGRVAEGMEFLNKMWKFQGPRKGIYQGSRNNHVEFPWVFNIGIGISKECSTSFRNSKGEASFCLEFLGVK